ncbi:MAG: 50S ribosomal protein L16 [Nitrososphaerota archaeon]
MRGSCYRPVRGMPYSRKEYIESIPSTKLNKFVMGTFKTDYDTKVLLVAGNEAQIRDNALEAARTAANKLLSREVGDANYYLLIKKYPHVILRENKMIATAGADRLQEGMRRAFGKPIGLAARVKAGEPVMEVQTYSTYLAKVKEALKVASSKLPISTDIRVTTAAVQR